MQVNSLDCIKKSEKNFIGELRKGFDWQTIRKIFRRRYRLDMRKAIVTHQGDIVVFNQQVAYRLDFKAMVPLSIVFDRKGNHLALTPGEEPCAGGGKSVSTDHFSGDAATGPPKDKEEITAYDLMPFENRENASDNSSFDPQKNISQMANKIALMISEINGK